MPFGSFSIISMHCAAFKASVISSRVASANNTPKDNGVVLEHVSYSYDGEKNALNDVSLKIRPGQVVALVGASGGGKTTHHLLSLRPHS
mgnify:CR=1 FL=1